MADTGGRRKTLSDDTPGPWSEWETHGRAERCIRFIEEYCRLPKGFGAGERMRLAEWQKEWIRDVLADEVRSAALSVPRGNGKSTLLAALAVWAVFDDDGSGAPQVPVVATTVQQAIRSVYGVAQAMVEAEEALSTRAKVYTGIGTMQLKVPSTGGEMYPVADTVDGLQGLDPSVAVCDEIGFISVESWDSLLLASGKRPHSLVVGIGTPGVNRLNALWHMRQRVLNGQALPGFRYTEYSADEGCKADDKHQWNKANPALAEGYMAEDALETAYALSPEGSFRAYRLGQWSDGLESWLGEDGARLWRELAQPQDFIEGEPAWIGVDVGLKRDSTAVVTLQETPNGYHAKVRIWSPGPERPVDVTDVQHHIREEANRYDVQAVSYDPRFFDVPATQLADEGIPMVEVPQSVDRMTRAVGETYALIMQGELTHDGDRLFQTHILNAMPRYNQHGFTLAKGKASGPIDGAIAMCMAVDRAVQRTRRRAPLVALL